MPDLPPAPRLASLVLPLVLLAGSMTTAAQEDHPPPVVSRHARETVLPHGESGPTGAAKEPHVVFMISEPEYETEITLPAFARRELEPRGVRFTLVFGEAENPDRLPGLEALPTADLLVVSVRRRALPAEQLQLVRDHLAAGKPLVGIRTASHAFHTRGIRAEGHAEWQEFDPQVLGGNYQGHHGSGPVTTVRVAEGAAQHPILSEVCAGLATECPPQEALTEDQAGMPPADRSTAENGGPAACFTSRGSLYRVSPLAATAQPLLVGEIPGQPAEPVAWTNTYGGSRIFYTSLGHKGDFDQPAFNRLLVNAVFWALDRPVPAARS